MYNYERLSVGDRNDIDYAIIMLSKMLKNEINEDEIKNNPNYKYIMHVILHRKAFKHLEEKTDYKGVYSKQHDIDKIGLALVLGKDKAKKIHHKWAPHHSSFDWSDPDELIFIEKIIDWECSHCTKLDRKETAWEYFIKKYSSPENIKFVEPLFLELNMKHKKDKKHKLTKKKYEEMVSKVSFKEVISEIQNSYDFLRKYGRIRIN